PRQVRLRVRHLRARASADLVLAARRSAGRGLVRVAAVRAAARRASVPECPARVWDRAARGWDQAPALDPALALDRARALAARYRAGPAIRPGRARPGRGRPRARR